MACEPKSLHAMVAVVRPESPKEGNQEREVQMDFLSLSGLEETRLPGRPHEPDRSRSETPPTRPGFRRGSSGQSLLPFDRPRPLVPQSNDVKPQDQALDSAPAWSEPLRLPASSQSTGEVARAHELIGAIRVLKLLESGGRSPKPEEREALSHFCGFGLLALRIFPDPTTGGYKS